MELLDPNKPNPDVIAHVEKLLARAKSGDIVGFMYFEELMGGTWSIGTVGCLDAKTTVFATAMMAREAVDDARRAPTVEEDDEP